jgi:hypothetical protein
MTNNPERVHYLIYVYVEPPPAGDAVPTSLCPGARNLPEPLAVTITDTTCPDCLRFILQLDMTEDRPE